jgi:hypothetical protein
VQKALRERLLWLVSENRTHEPEFVSVDPKTLKLLGAEPIGGFLPVRATSANLDRGFMIVGKRGWVHIDYVSFKEHAPPPKEFTPWLRIERGVINVTSVEQRITGWFFNAPWISELEHRAFGTYEGATKTLFQSALCHPVQPGQLWVPPEARADIYVVKEVTQERLRGAPIPLVHLRNTSQDIAGPSVWLPELYLNWCYGIDDRQFTKPPLDAYDKLLKDDLL